MFACIRCLGTPQHPAPVVALDGVNSVCLEHLAAAWRDDQLCRACRYWVATVGDLCDACAGADLRTTPPPENR